jgi:uncharacterized membrane protein YGL010W
MRNATELLVQYARYHRDRRNIGTHMFGVPLIVFAIGVLLGRVSFEVGGTGLTLGWVAFGLAAAWYLSRDLVLGLATSAAVGFLVALAHLVTGAPFGQWLAWGLGSFVLGWIIQFVGHYYEGRKPAFVDDLIGLMVGPMFLTAEVMFSLGWNRRLLDQITDIAGPTHIRDLAHPA